MSSNLDKFKFIITDHTRAACFIIADGVMPSGKQRGYVLRKLIRRSFSAALKLKIDISNKNYFQELVESVNSIFAETYPEITENQEKIVEVLYTEAVKYLGAIETGKKVWAKILVSQ